MWIHMSDSTTHQFPIATEYPFTYFSKPMSFISSWVWSRGLSIERLREFQECCIEKKDFIVRSFTLYSSKIFNTALKTVKLFWVWNEKILCVCVCIGTYQK